MAEEQFHILIAEDNVAMAGVIRFNLARAGFEVTVAHCGDEAWELASQRTFDLIVTDFQMPGMTGGELARRVREEAGNADVPIIFLTAKGFELDLSYYQDELHVAAFVPKPFSPRALVELVGKCLGKSDVNA